ncbi:hypothetical protein U9M48_000439 [Paspalum notatum var. saurae]|uniref:Tf2-1-like SH3-like domain-containing protein n=1 Tax=Paspalum notatum var. saurae TaxID=547442 RepID=A0AAQ3SCD5_PASNO
MTISFSLRRRKKTIFQTLRELYAQLKECAFCLLEVSFLGHVINEKVILVDPSKVSTVVWDHVLLKVSPTKGVVRFGNKGKLSPRYIGPFTIVARIRKLAYRLELPDSMKGVNNVYHVSMLQKYLRDPEHHITLRASKH